MKPENLWSRYEAGEALPEPELTQLRTALRNDRDFARACAAQRKGAVVLETLGWEKRHRHAAFESLWRRIEHDQARAGDGATDDAFGMAIWMCLPAMRTSRIATFDARDAAAGRPVGFPRDCAFYDASDRPRADIRRAFMKCLEQYGGDLHGFDGWAVAPFVRACEAARASATVGVLLFRPDFTWQLCVIEAGADADAIARNLLDAACEVADGDVDAAKVARLEKERGIRVLAVRG
jgi:hypothetical protein